MLINNIPQVDDDEEPAAPEEPAPEVEAPPPPEDIAPPAEPALPEPVGPQVGLCYLILHEGVFHCFLGDCRLDADYNFQKPVALNEFYLNIGGKRRSGGRISKCAAQFLTVNMTALVFTKTG